MTWKRIHRQLDMYDNGTIRPRDQARPVAVGLWLPRTGLSARNRGKEIQGVNENPGVGGGCREVRQPHDDVADRVLPHKTVRQQKHDFPARQTLGGP